MQQEEVVKITNAVYKILDFLPENDPLKNKAKEKVLAILENATLMNNLESRSNAWFSLEASIRQGYGVGKETVKRQLWDDIEMLEHYLKVGKHLGWIDTVNFLIITKEYSLIKNSIVLLEPLAPEVDKEVKQEIAAPKPEFVASEIASGGIAEKNVLQKKAETPKKENQGYSPRQSKILEILGKSKKAQVSDFIKQLPNITKRTIRRDLDDLLKRGTVARVGEWNQVFYVLN